MEDVWPDTPGFSKLAERGWRLTWWPNEPDGHIYGFASAVSHNNLYPLGATLVESVSNGHRVLRVGPPRDEVLWGGVSAALAFFRTMNLIFSFLGWPHEELDRIYSLISDAHAILQAAPPAPP